MGAVHAHAATTLVTNSSAPESRSQTAATVRPKLASSEHKLRVLIAERRAAAHSELSRRLDRVGHEVLARVTSVQGVLDYAQLLRPDVVLIAPLLEDGPGVMAAASLTREMPGIAAVVLTTHPAALDRAARPNWGAVTLVPADAEPSDLDEELWRAVEQARTAEPAELSPEAEPDSASVRPADLAPAVELTPQYETPIEHVAPIAPAPRTVTVPLSPAVATAAPGVRPEVAPPKAGNGRPPLSFSDEDLLAIGPMESGPVAPIQPVVEEAVTVPAVPAPTTAYGSDTEIIAEAAETLLERTGLSRSDAMRLMEQEAADTGRQLVEIALTVLGRDGASAGTG